MVPEPQKKGGHIDATFMAKYYKAHLFSAIWPLNYVILGL